MTPAHRITGRLVTFLPEVLNPGVLYVSVEYATTAHLCACGCGAEVVAPLGPGRWSLSYDGTTSLFPSIGNGNLACRSHYWIDHDTIRWATPMTPQATRRAQDADHRALAPGRRPWWHRLRFWHATQKGDEG